MLSSIGLHGGNVKIVADNKRSTSTHQVPIKPSIGGVKARRFLKFHGKHGKLNSKQGGSTIKYEQWRKLHNAVKDHGDNGQARKRKAQVWNSLNKIFEFCDKPFWKDEDNEPFKKALKDFGRNMKEAWSQKSITHYMVRINHYTLSLKNYNCEHSKISFSFTAYPI